MDTQKDSEIIKNVCLVDFEAGMNDVQAEICYKRVCSYNALLAACKLAQAFMRSYSFEHRDEFKSLTQAINQATK